MTSYTAASVVIWGMIFLMVLMCLAIIAINKGNRKLQESIDNRTRDKSHITN